MKKSIRFTENKSISIVTIKGSFYVFDSYFQNRKEKKCKGTMKKNGYIKKGSKPII